MKLVVLFHCWFLFHLICVLAARFFFFVIIFFRAWKSSVFLFVFNTHLNKQYFYDWLAGSNLLTFYMMGIRLMFEETGEDVCLRKVGT